MLSIEERYDNWNRKIYRRLGLTWGAPLSTARDDTWLLVPLDDQEFTEQEQADLFETVRLWLFAPSAPVIENRQAALLRVERLWPQTSLPLLYASRVIARRFGRSGRYWPDFARHLFGDRTPDQQEFLAFTRQAFAGKLSACWRKLRQETGNRLYEPRKGKVNIKWPLAHAGLLKAEQDRIRAFGAVLYGAANGNREGGLISVGDFPDFTDALTQWLTEQGVRDSLYESIITENSASTSSDADRRVVLCEMAQWLIAREWDSLASVAERMAPSPMNFYPRLKLYFNAGERHLRFGVTRTVLHGNVTNLLMKISFTGQPKSFDFNVPLFHSEATSRSYPKPDAFPGPISPQQIVTVQTDIKRGDGKKTDPRKQIAFPLSTYTGTTLIFRAETGEVADMLEPGESYYLIGPRECLSGSAAYAAREALFEAHFDDGFLPEVGWSEYQIFAVNVRALPRITDPAERHRFAEEWTNAAETLGVQGISDLWRPRLILIGGRVVGYRAADDATSIYQIDAPPLVEVHGDVVGRTLSLERIGPNNVMTRVAQVIADSSAVTDLLDLFGVLEPTPGEYRVQINRRRACAFRLVDSAVETPIKVASTPIPEADLTMVLGLERQPARQGWGVARTSRSGGTDELRQGKLLLTGWPFAALRLNIHKTDGTGGTEFPDVSLPCTLDAHGRAELRWSDTGLDNLLTGGIRIQAEWNGLVRSKTLFFANQNCIPDGLRVSGSRFVRIEGKVHQAQGSLSSVTEVTLCVIGDAPWNGDLWTTIVPVSENGDFCGEWACVFPPHWVAVYSTGPTPLSPAIAPASPAGNERIRESISTMMRGKSWDAWSQAARSLRNVPLPVDLLALIPRCHAEDALEWQAILENWQQKLFYRSSLNRWLPLNNVRRAEAILQWKDICLEGHPWRFVPFLHENKNCPQEGYLYERAGSDASWDVNLLSSGASGFGFGRKVALYPGGAEAGKPTAFVELVGRSDDSAYCRLRPALEDMFACRRCGVVGIARGGGNHNLPVPGTSCPGNPTLRIPITDGAFYNPFILCVLWSPLRTFDILVLFLTSLKHGEDVVPPERFLPFHERLENAACTAVDQGEISHVHAYLTGLLHCLSDLRRQAVDGRINDRGVLGRFIQRHDTYRPALSILWEWFSAEMEAIQP